MNRAAAGSVGVLSAGLALGTTELVVGLMPGGRSLFVAVGDAVIGLTPGPVVRFAISTFGSSNRLVLLTSMAVGVVTAAILIGIAAERRRWVGVAGFTGFGILGAVAALTDPLVPAFTAALAPTLGALAGLSALGVLLRAADRATAGPSLAAAPVTMAGRAEPPPGVAQDPRIPTGSRRTFLALAAAAGGGAAVFAVTGRSLQARSLREVARSTTPLPAVAAPLPRPGPTTTHPVPGISPLITPNDEFFRIDTALTVPRIDPLTHRVRVHGMVETPFELTYAELLDLADTEADVTLSCVSNEVGGRLVGNARWLGVPLAELLDRAGVHPDATQVVGRSVDGWTSGFPVEAARDGRAALVAVGMNGEPLPSEHGFPVRLVIPGLYGYVANTKWLSEIELTTFEAHDAYWIPRGWARMGPIKTQSRIDVPSTGAALAAGTVTIAGVAWADERGVTGVQVAVDDGPWVAADLADELSIGTWRQWRLDWDATPGQHVLAVRALDADDVPQTAEVTTPAPDGATGHHTIAITVS